ncbi:MAG: aspartate aminotransferase family protein [Candidatus Hodarchaeota archaeon]
MKNAILSYHTYADLPIVESGKGIYLKDIKGKTYIDASSGAVVVGIGHGREEIAEVLRAQAAKIAYVIRVQFMNIPSLELSNKIATLAPKNMNRSYFVSGGSEANETAIKLSIRFQQLLGNPKKTKIISRWQSYHGNTLGALSVSGHTKRRRDYSNLLLHMPLIPPVYCYRCPFNKKSESCDLECARELEVIVKREGPENIAAFIAEPIVGATLGAVPPVDEYFPLIREICDTHEMLFIADEIMTGFGRTGKYFAMEYWNVTPDILSFGKGVTAGYSPLAGIITHKRISETFEDKATEFVHGFTFAFNPLTTAVALKVLEIVEEEQLIENAKIMGEYFVKRLTVLEELPIVGDIRGKGLLFGIEFVKNKEWKEPFPPNDHMAYKIMRDLMDRGLVIYPGSGTKDGLSGDHILLAPPLIITKDEINKIIQILQDYLSGL